MKYSLNGILLQQNCQNSGKNSTKDFNKTCEPKAFSFQCMTKFTTKKKKIIN